MDKPDVALRCAPYYIDDDEDDNVDDDDDVAVLC